MILLALHPTWDGDTFERSPIEKRGDPRQKAATPWRPEDRADRNRRLEVHSMAAMTCVTRATCRAASKGERTRSTFLSRPARARSPRTLADPLSLSLLRRSCAATRRQTSAKVVLKPIGDNNADYVIRSGLNQPPQATAITVSENPGNSQIPRQHAFEKADLDLRLQPSLRLDLTLLSRFEPLLRSFSSLRKAHGGDLRRR